MRIRPLLALSLGAVALLGASVPSHTSMSSARTTFSAFSEADAVTAGSPHAATGSPYKFTALVSGKPVRWNPCTPIHWQFRAAGAPKHGRAVVNAAVARIAKITGTRWVFDGVVSNTPGTPWLPSNLDTIRPVLIGWTDGKHSDLLRGRPAGVLGVTRTAWFGWTDNGTTVASIRAAVIALDRTDRLPSNGPVSWKTVLLHELAHAMGLDHAGSSHELMFPVLQRSLPDLQKGDVQGLTKVGRRAGCVNA
ncbi:MAG: Peptidase metallopeptidase [Frankiales bacterium]|nr:Peptidase metallopeptidase [Frankiales bacterium]